MGLIIARRQKSLKEIEGKWQKIWIVMNTWKTHVLKKHSERFSIVRKIDSIDWKLHSIDPAAIEHQSSQADSNQILIAISIG